ncbi:hypothetical protein ABBQ32_012714 [Trebouxia sp. C0010 RCD-2024]
MRAPRGPCMVQKWGVPHQDMEQQYCLAAAQAPDRSSGQGKACSECSALLRLLPALDNGTVQQQRSWAAVHARNHKQVNMIGPEHCLLE